MKKVVVVCLLSVLMLVCASNVAVPVLLANGGDIVTTGDPLPHDEWE